MIARFKQEPLPSWWRHPTLNLHRAWTTRRMLQSKSRAVLVLLVIVLLVVWAVAAHPAFLLLAVLGVFYPAPSAKKVLLEVERSVGAAYTTALTAQPDAHGLKTRLEGMALAAQKIGELPGLPYLEALGMALVVSLLLVLPPRQTVTTSTPDQAITRTPENPSNRDTPPTENAQPVIDATSRNAPPAGGEAKPGVAASGGSVSEQNLGELKSGGGRANEDPEAISKDFLEALERGTVRQPDPKANQQNGKVEDANPPQAGQSGSRNGSEDGQGENGSGSGSSSKPQNRTNKQNQSGNSTQNGQNQNGQSGTGQNGQSSAQNDTAQNGAAGQNAQPQGNSNSSSGNKNTPRDPRGNSLDRGENGQDFDPNSNSGNNANRGTTPGNGSKNAQGNPVAANRRSGTGKLEYLQGTPKGQQVRSGALQLPGDPKNGFTSPTSSASYRRAAEAAVLDPRLPPEYQEMLKNYYR